MHNLARNVQNFLRDTAQLQRVLTRQSMLTRILFASYKNISFPNFLSFSIQIIGFAEFALSGFGFGSNGKWVHDLVGIVGVVLGLHLEEVDVPSRRLLWWLVNSLTRVVQSRLVRALWFQFFYVRAFNQCILGITF